MEEHTSTIAEPQRAGDFVDAFDCDVEETVERCVAPLLADKKKARSFKGVDALMRDFSALGGRVAVAPMEEAGSWFDPKEGFSIGVRASDIVVPVCHAGQNRAQTARMVLLAVKRRQGCAVGTASAASWDEVGTGPAAERTVTPPHGSIQAWDPYASWKDLGDCTDMTQMCKYMPSALPEKDRAEEAFVEAFGEPKQARVGHELAEGMDMMGAAFGGSATPSEVERDRTAMHDWFSANFFSQEQARFGDRRIIFFCFEKAGPVVLTRAIEAARQSGARCDRMRILMIPYGDHIKCGKTAGSQAKYGLKSHADAYVRTFGVIASLIVPLLEEEEVVVVEGAQDGDEPTPTLSQTPTPTPPRWTLTLDKMEKAMQLLQLSLITQTDYEKVKHRLLDELINA